jgi:hypothetical protein
LKNLERWFRSTDQSKYPGRVLVSKSILVSKSRDDKPKTLH